VKALFRCFEALTNLDRHWRALIVLGIRL
jgi:hypothetical protein